jgi:hypothetical protein
MVSTVDEFPSIPQFSQFKSYTEKNTLSVDGFLYEEDDIDDLCDAGKLSRNYCLGIKFIDA